MKITSSKPSFINKKIRHECGMDEIYRTPSKYEKSPSKVMSEGVLIARKPSGTVWLSVGDSGWEIASALEAKSYEETSFSISECPPSIRKENSPEKKAFLSYNKGFLKHEALSWGASEAFFDYLSDKYKGAVASEFEMPGYRRPFFSQEEENRKLSTIVSLGQTYGDWKGITGPGAKLKEIIKPKDSDFKP